VGGGITHLLTESTHHPPHLNQVHIRVQQRNGRKCITTVAGLGEDLDMKKILKVRSSIRPPAPKSLCVLARVDVVGCLAVPAVGHMPRSA